MAKIVVGLALVVFCGFCGYLLTKKYRLRKDFFRQYAQFNRNFLSEIAFSRRPIESVIKNGAYSGDFESLINSFLTALKNGDTKLLSMALPDFLDADEKTFVEEYFAYLGRGDSAGQKGYFAIADQTIAQKKDESEKLSKKHVDLYIKMGILLGLALLIVLL